MNVNASLVRRLQFPAGRNGRCPRGDGGVGSRRGLATFWPFVVYSAAFLGWRSRSLTRACCVTAGIHVLNNSVAALLLVLSSWGAEA